ncbi:M56 family metallopeptidase [Actinomadura keratinilytica]
MASRSLPQLVITTAALRRLKGRQLDAIAAHEQGHATMRHDWLRHISAALAHGFPQVAFFAAFRDEMHRLVELAADDMASRRFGRLTTALALVELNEDRGVFGPSPAPEAHLPQRVHRLLAPQAGSRPCTGCGSPPRRRWCPWCRWWSPSAPVSSP